MAVKIPTSEPTMRPTTPKWAPLLTALTGYLFVAIPKGFFPQQDTGLITGISEAPQDVSFARMVELQEELGRIVQADPAVDTIAMAIGGSGGTAINNGRMFITLKPLEKRDASADRIIARLRPKLDEVQGAKLFLQAAQEYAAPQVVLEATHIRATDIVPLELLRAHAVERDR